MKKPSRAGSKPAKARPHSALKPTGRNAPKPQSNRRSAADDSESEVAQLKRELHEALEQQRAISDILRVISNSPGDVQPVLDSVAQHAARICEAQVVDISIVDHNVFRIAASFGEMGRRSTGETLPLDRSTVTGRSICDLEPVHVADEQNAGEEFPLGREMAIKFGNRTILSVPLIREGRALGAILVRRAEVRPFEQKHIALLTAFADQAALAIGNVRLFKAEQQRTRELTESLQQQTATADVLKVISRSTFDLQAVLDTLVESAASLCHSDHAGLFRREGEFFRNAASFGFSKEAQERIKQYWLTRVVSPGRGSVVGRTALEAKPVQIADVLADPEYTIPAQEHGNYRTALGIPLLREGVPIGVLTLMRSAPQSFTDKQIEVLTTFADQAVIAIENTGLFEAEQQRTRELTESLEQQTATSEVLQVISGSPGDLEPVFAAMLEKAVLICDAKFGNIYRWDGNALHVSATYNTPPAYAEVRRHSTFRADQNRPLGRVILTKTVVHIADLAAEPSYIARIPQTVAAVELGGVRTFLAVPMLNEGELIGAFGLARQEVRPFTDKQIELVQNFAAQAVIAIENTRLLNELRQRTNDLTESLEQQTATSDVLRVISSSPSDIQPVLEIIGERAEKLCNAEISVVSTVDGELIRLASIHGMTEAGVEATRRSFPAQRTDERVTARAIRTRSVCHVADVLSDPQYQYKDTARVIGLRGCLGVPMVRDEQVVGAIFVARRQPELFSDTQVQLLKTFADQAVIAIENVRLFKETKTSLEQQTATADVLKVISRSAFDLRTVLTALTESAAQLCAADMGLIFRQNGDVLRLVASFGISRDAERYWLEHPVPVDRGTTIGRALLQGRAIHIPDVLADPEYRATRDQEVVGYRTTLAVPLLRDGTTIGIFALGRREPNPFPDKQIELVTTFADQAVIAIENARLLSELRESLQQQTATADVLKVISRSTFDLQTVLNTLVESAARLCEADVVSIGRPKGKTCYFEASYGFSREYAEFVASHPAGINRGTVSGRVLLERKIVHVLDVLADPEYSYETQKVGGFRTLLGVPLLREGSPIGVIALGRNSVRAFTDKQIELVTTFADQAVIAIENVRLLDELRARTDQLVGSVKELQALGEVSQAVNSTLDIETVLSTIVAKAVQLSGTEAGAIYVFDNAQREFYLRATYGMDQELIEALTQRHIGLDEPNITPAFLAGEPIQVSDLREAVSSAANDIVLRAGFRARLVTPLLRGEEIVGMLVVRRRTPGAFPQNTVDLMKTFAAQSVLAIENARLFKNVETSLEDLRTAQDRLIQTEKLASLGQLTAGIAHEIKNPLNFVNNFSAVSVELIDELREALGGVHVDNKLRAEISEIADTLQGNLDKVVQHGKRADAIVKNMLLHSRQGSGEHRPVDINALVEESLNLAYHGARAEKQGFTITLERSFDPAAGEADLFPQEITRALLNLISNGFYAATKRKAEANGGNYEPTVAAATKNLGDRVEIRIRDNGTGIPPEVKERLFSPFFTTKPAGEGTGLGLSISHDIIVKQHGGSIEVDTQPGEFTEFRIVLPRRGASLAAGRA